MLILSDILFAFRRLSEKQKSQKLCALCGSAVNYFVEDPSRVMMVLMEKPPWWLGIDATPERPGLQRLSL